MSKICRYCGAMNSDSNHKCCRCGKDLPGTQPVPMMENNQRNRTITNSVSKIGRSFDINKNNASKFIYILIGIGICVVLGVVIKLVFFSTSETDLEKMVPKEVLQYKMQIEEQYDHECKIDSFEVEKRDTSEEYDTAYCKIEMSDQYISRTTYLRMDMKKYEKGGWMLESYSEYDKEKLEIKEKEVVGKTAAEIYAKDLILTNPECTFNSETEMQVSYTPYIEHEFLSFEGTVGVTFEFETQDNEYPHSYCWTSNDYTDIDFSNVSYSWNLEGNWEATVEDYDVKLELTKNSDTNYSIHGYASEYYEDFVDKDILFDDDDPHVILLEKEEYQSVVVSFYISYPGFNLYITPDRLKISEGGFMSMNTVENAVDLTQY